VTNVENPIGGVGVVVSGEVKGGGEIVHTNISEIHIPVKSIGLGQSFVTDHGNTRDTIIEYPNIVTSVSQFVTNGLGTVIEPGKTVGVGTVTKNNNLTSGRRTALVHTPELKNVVISSNDTFVSLKRETREVILDVLELLSPVGSCGQGTVSSGVPHGVFV